MIEFWLNSRSGVPPYLQIIQQVKHAVLVGRLKAGDRLPTVREVVSQVAINPNTVFKAYRELVRTGIVEMRPGLGTFVRDAPKVIAPGDFSALRRSLLRWTRSARQAGLDAAAMEALLMATLSEDHQMEEGTA
jgi:GntR family transcriptional regulator